VPQDIKTVARPPTFVEPRPASPIRIEYPEEARKFGHQGVVEIELTVNESGVVTAARVASSSGVPLLDEAAHRVLSAARFEPARRNGLAVPYTFRQAVRFVLRLQDKSPAK
jgi:protein TonB